MGQAFVEGFLLQASLIFALGAQNIYVLETGLTKTNRLAVSLTCAICDLTIIMAGVIGTAGLLAAYPEIKIVFGVLGVAFMLHYGFGKVLGRDESKLELVERTARYSIKKAVLKAIVFSTVNPHAYLDGIVLIGGYASKYEQLGQRVMLGWGAACYSLFWFLLLSNASGLMLPLLKEPRQMRLVRNVTGVILLGLSCKLSIDVYGWVKDVITADPSIVLNNATGL